MGAVSSKGDASKYGQIFIQTDKPAYFAGETVTGKIFLNILIPYPGRTLSLKLKGKESVHYIKEVRREGITHNFHEKNNKDIIKLKVPVYTWDSVVPGQYSVPFSFLLPQGLPSTFHQEGRRYLANLSYRLEAILEPNLQSDPPMKYKQNLIVRTSPKNAIGETQSQITSNLTSCCCCEKGTSYLTVKFQKNWYVPGEIVQVIVSFDNTYSKLQNQKITLALRQNLKIRAQSDHSYQLTVVSRNIDGVETGKTINEAIIAINLPTLQEGDYRNTKKFDLEDYLLYLNENKEVMHSETHGSLITSTYELEVSCEMEGCCSTTPRVILPIEIHYPEIPLPKVTAPNGWQPQEMRQVMVAFNQQNVQSGNQQVNLGSNTMAPFK